MIKNQRVFWSGQYLFPDTDDPGDEPDVGLLEGTVTFAPVWDAGVSGLLSDSQRSTYVKPFPIEIRDGQLMSDDDGTWIPGVKIPASIGGHPLAWVARFDLSAGGEKVAVRELRFTSNPDGEVHLHNVIPAEAIYPQLPPDIVKGDSVTNIYNQGQYVVFIVGEPPRTKQYVLAFPGTDEAIAGAEAALQEMRDIRDDAEIQIGQTRDAAEDHINRTRDAAEIRIGHTRDDAETTITQTRDEAVTTVNQTRTAAETTITQTRDEAVSTVDQTRTAAETVITQTRTDAEASITQTRTDAETAITQTRDEAVSTVNQVRTDAETSMAQTLTQANDARDAAETSRGRAHDSEVAAGESARDAAADRAIVSDLKVQVDNSRSHVDQRVQDFDADYLAAQVDIDNRVAGWGTQFDQDLLTFQGLKTEMQNIATDVAADVAHLDGIAEQVEDALDVVRAHRWVPRGEWDAATTYVAGDVVVFDGGSYYAGADIPVGTPPPGGQWVVLGQGGISDASELSGKLGPLVDAADASVDLSAEVGVPPEMHDALLREILGTLVRGVDSTVDADRVEGAVTEHLDLSNGMVTFNVWNPETESFYPLVMDAGSLSEALYAGMAYASSGVSEIQGILPSKADLVSGKVPLGQLPELNSAGNLTGALTGQVEADGATVEYMGQSDGTRYRIPLRELALYLADDLLTTHVGPSLEGKSDKGHKHTRSDITDLDPALALKADLDGSGKLLASQLPALAITEFLGTVASQAAMLALSGQRGDWCVRTDRGTQWILIADNPAVVGSWREMVTPAAPVSSVAGRTGAVTLSKSDVGLSSVDNTSDLNKPISSAVSAALGTKAASDHTHTPASIGAEPAQWYGTQAQYDAISPKDPNRTYNILEG